MIAGLALATEDPDLRQQVELLATDPGLVAQFTGLVDSESIQVVQNGVATRLRQHQNRSLR